MNYKILGDSDCPLVQISLLSGETVKLERGSMAYITDVELEGKMNSNKKGLGGVLGAIGRSITSGESMFITHAKGTSNRYTYSIAPPIPGKIHCLKVDSSQQYRLNTGAFLACDESVDYTMKSQDIGESPVRRHRRSICHGDTGIRGCARLCIRRYSCTKGYTGPPCHR